MSIVQAPVTVWNAVCSWLLLVILIFNKVIYLCINLTKEAKRLKKVANYQLTHISQLASESYGTLSVGVFRQCTFVYFGRVALEWFLMGGWWDLFGKSLSKFNWILLVSPVLPTPALIEFPKPLYQTPFKSNENTNFSNLLLKIHLTESNLWVSPNKFLGKKKKKLHGCILTVPVYGVAAD